MSFPAYLKYREMQIASDNLNSLKQLINEQEDDDEIPVWKLKELLRVA